MGGRFSEAGALGGEDRAVDAHGLAAAGLIGGKGLLDLAEAQWLVADPDAAQGIPQDLLGGRPTQQADGALAQTGQVGDAAGHGHHHVNAVVEVDRSEAEGVAAGRIAREGEGGGASQQIDLPTGHGGETGIEGDGVIRQLLGIAEHSRRHALAEIHLKAAVPTLGIGAAETWCLAVDATVQPLAAANRRQCFTADLPSTLRASGAGRQQQHQAQGAGLGNTPAPSAAQRKGGAIIKPPSRARRLAPRGRSREEPAPTLRL